MSFKYNENLDFFQRVKLVIDEIKKEYPLIDNDAAVMSAILSSSVDDKPTNEEKFERYYFLLMHSKKEDKEFIHVFNDLYDIYEEGLDDVYSKCALEVINYVFGKRNTFPLLEEFY